MQDYSINKAAVSKNCFCTIITSDHYPYARALYASLKKYDADVVLFVLITDGVTISSGPGEDGIQILPAKNILHYSLARRLYEKYAHESMDWLRWSLKPVFIAFLLENGFDKVIFSDCDIYFFASYRFLFDELNRYSMLLTPHWYATDPAINEESFAQLLKSGVFNAGFIGTNKSALPALQWWAKACYHKMGISEAEGIYDDQKYLDLVPSLFENIHVLKHKGCNLGSQNYEECKREKINNEILIDEKYPIVCIHFSDALIKQILKGHDPLLLPHFNEYKHALESSGTPFKKLSGSHFDKYLEAGAFTKLKWRLQLRARLRRMLQNLSRKL